MESQYARGQQGSAQGGREYYANAAGAYNVQSSARVPLTSSNAVPYMAQSKPDGGDRHTSSYGYQAADPSIPGTENLRLSQGYSDREGVRTSQGYGGTDAWRERENLRNSQGYSDSSRVERDSSRTSQGRPSDGIRERENLRNSQGYGDASRDREQQLMMQGYGASSASRERERDLRSAQGYTEGAPALIAQVKGAEGFSYKQFMQMHQQQQQQQQPQQQQQQQYAPGQQQQQKLQQYVPSNASGRTAASEDKATDQRRQPYKSVEQYRADLYQKQQVALPATPPSETRHEPLHLSALNASPNDETDEVKRLRTALATTTAELGRQIERYQIENTAGQQARVDWLQKLLVQQEAKVSLLDSELKDAQSKERNMRHKFAQVESLEKQNQILKEQQNRMVYEQQASKKSAGSSQLEEKVRQLTAERDSLNTQLDDMMRRQSSQSSGPRSDPTPTSTDPLLIARIKEAEARAMSLMQQSVALAEERDALRTQLDSQKQNLSLEKESSLAVANQEMKDAQNEILNLKKRIMQLQSASQEEQARIASRLSGQSVAASQAADRAHELELQHGVIIKQLQEAEDKNLWLGEQLRTFESNRSSVERMHLDSLFRRDITIQSMAVKSVRLGALERIVRGWSDLTLHSQVRLQSLYSLLKTLHNRWQKRFFRNHFMAWKFLFVQRRKHSSEFAASLRAEGLKNVLSSWHALARESKVVGEHTASLHLQYTKETDDLRKQHDGQLANTQRAFSSELDTMRAMHRAEIERMTAEAAEEARTRDQEREQLKARLEGDLSLMMQEREELRERLENDVHLVMQQRDHLQASLEGELAAAQQQRDEQKERLEAEIESIREQWDTAVKDLAAKAADEKEAISKSAANTLKIELQRASDDLAHAQQAHRQEMEELAERHMEVLKEEAAVLERVKGGHDETLKRLKADKESALADAQRELARVVADFEAKAVHQADVHSIEMQNASKEWAKREAEFQQEIADLKEEMEKLKESTAEEVVSAREQCSADVERMQEQMAAAEKKAKEAAEAAREEFDRVVERTTKACTERVEELEATHSKEVAALKEDAAEMQSNLRAKIVAEKAKADQEAEEVRFEHSKKEDALRKKVLEKEKEVARNLEAAELERQKAVEDGEEELQKLQRDHERKMDEMRAAATKAQDDIRHKMHQKEKEFNAKMEALRAENIASQEQFQNDLQEKEASFRRKLEQEKSLQAQVDSLMSSSSIKELQAKIVALQQDVGRVESEKADMVAQEGALRKQISAEKREAQNKAESLRALRDQEEYLNAKLDEQAKLIAEHGAREEKLSARLEEALANLGEAKQAQAVLLRQVNDAAADLDEARSKCALMDEEARRKVGALEEDARKRCSEVEEQLRHKCTLLEEEARQAQKEVAAAQAEKTKLSEELCEASNALLKRGDDFSESVRLLQGRFEAADMESRELQDRLKTAHNTNARLAAELEEASEMLQKYTDKRNSTSDVEEMLKRRLEGAQRDLQQAELNFQERLDAAHKASIIAQNELKNDVARAERESQDRIKEADARANWLSEELERQSFRANALSPMTPMSINGDAEQELLEMRRRLERTERENNTLTDELDNCLAENAQLRSDLDDLRDAGDAPPSASSHSRPRGSFGRELFGGRHVVTTCGVHTSRLVREVFACWVDMALEARMGGQTPMFSGLEFFQSQDGTLAPWFPVGRIRRGELDIRSDKLGTGSFAEVFKGEWKIPVAVKKMRGNIQHKELLEFVREGEMLRCLSHPCIVKLMGVYQEGQTYSLVQECVSGVNLFDFLHKFHKTVPLDKQLSIALQVCDALAYIHETRIVHRDVKPQNVIYQEKTGTAKLCDFGLARMMPKGVEELHPETLGTGGTPAYQAPEVLRRKHVGRKLDQYGFAITLWEMFTRKLPWADCNLEQMTQKVSGRNERPSIPQDMPRDYAEVITSCWRTEPTSRPEFADISPMLTRMYEALSPEHRVLSSGRSSASSVGAASTASTASARSVTTKVVQPQRTNSGGSGAQPQRTNSGGSGRNVYAQQQGGATSLPGHASSKFVPGSYGAF